MKWLKKGLIYGPQGEYEWAQHTALTPTPLLISDEIIRVYAGFRDKEGVSRIGFVDVDADNPSKVLQVSPQPVLDIGRPGTFDDNGIILGDVIQVGKEFWMYYVGFQLVKKVKFLAFSGLAISKDGGLTFERYSESPILDRTSTGLYIRAVHSVLLKDNLFKIWYSTGNEWQVINGQSYPRYEIRYCESANGVNFMDVTDSTLCIHPVNNEYRIGRPRVYLENETYRMFYTKGTLQQDYVPGYAESNDGKKWNRLDNKIGITLSNEGWDSKTLCYPSLLNYKNCQYMFYNGNNMGKDGFGYAILQCDD